MALKTTLLENQRVSRNREAKKKKRGKVGIEEPQQLLVLQEHDSKSQFIC